MNDRWDEPLFQDQDKAAFTLEAEEPARFWTAWRVLYALIVLLLILALLAYILWPLLLALTQPPTPPRPAPPFDIVWPGTSLSLAL